MIVSNVQDPGGFTKRVRWLDRFILIAVSAAGLLAIALPFIVSATGQLTTDEPRVLESSLLLGVTVSATLLLTIGQLFRPIDGGSASRIVVLLGVLVAIDATLRLMPSLLGASPIFALIMLVGYVFGARIGFMMGVMTLLLSAAITAGIGPWLPFQMLCAGWIGMGAGWLPHDRGRIPLLVFGAATGFAFGAVMNLYSWPYAAPGSTTDVGLYWNPTLSLFESLQRYASFYLATSLLHDATRATANVILLLFLGGPVIRLLQRYQTHSTWSPLSQSTSPPHYVSGDT
jgi:energy-coupling factor transport system substrate-specific component